MRKTLLAIALLSASSAYAYEANCKLDNGKELSISVVNKVMIVDHKWKVFFKNKVRWNNSFLYENKGYKYSVGEFDSSSFPIAVTNKYKSSTITGNCHFK